MKISKRGVALSVGATVVAGFAVIAYANHAATTTASSFLYDRPTEVPKAEVGLVLGCAKEVNGRPNLYFDRRIAAAAELWHADKVTGFIVSGDHSRQSYNEPHDMRAALVQKGVPRERIVCDYAGLRTLDSVVRAKEIFGVTDLIVVSQKFHNERALYIAQTTGIKASALNAQAVTGRAGSRTNVREYLARAKMLLDLHLFAVKPRYLGKKEVLPWRD